MNLKYMMVRNLQFESQKLSIATFSFFQLGVFLRHHSKLGYDLSGLDH